MGRVLPCARLADRTATEAKDRLEKQGSLLTRRLEYLEVGSRQALDLEVEQLPRGRQGVVACSPPPSQWTPCSTAARNDGRGLLLTAADGDATQEETSKIGWVMSTRTASGGDCCWCATSTTDHAGVLP